MARHGFGRGEYRYFAYPLPSVVQRLRTVLYAPLVPIANAWHEAMGLPPRFKHAALKRRDKLRWAGNQGIARSVDAIRPRAASASRATSLAKFSLRR